MSGEPREVDALLGKVVLGRYRLVRELARGGMGAIYLARSEGAASFVKPVVVKRMLPEFIGDAEAAKMFKREARIMSTLRHPGIVSVFDFGREDAGYMLVMDYVHGFHLGRWAGWAQQTRGEVPVQVAVHVVCQVLDALHYAHTLQGPDGESLHIVHRDVSPSNVLIDVGGHVQLADFGIAQSQGDAPDVKTSTRTVKGKFSYLAPEILEGAVPTPSSDVYSAAVVLHEVLIGRNEFRTANATSTVSRVLSVTPTRLDKLRPDASDELAEIVAMALAKKPEERFVNAAELARALRRSRGMETEEAQQLLADTFGRDFRDPSLPAMFELPELDELERAWRVATPSVTSEPPSAPDRPTLRPQGPRDGERRSDEPTTGGHSSQGSQRAEVAHANSVATVPPPPLEAVAQPRRGVPVAAWIGVGLLAVAGAGAAVWAATRPVVEPDVVYVQASPAGIGPTETGTETGTETETGAPTQTGTATDAGAATGTAGTAATPREPRPRTEREPRSPEEREAAAIQQAFGRHTSQIRGCFSAAPPGSPEELVLRFSIDAGGTVQRVELAPAGVASTPQGQCVTRLAQAIRFPQTAAPRSFRIPIQVRTR